MEPHGARAAAGRDRDRRAERLRQVERRRRHPLGARRAEPEAPPRRRHGGRHLQRQRRASARSAWRRCRCFSSAARTTCCKAEQDSDAEGACRRPAAASSRRRARSWSRAATSAPATRSTSSTRRPCRLKDITELFLGTGVGIEGVRHHRAGPRRAARERQAGGAAALHRGGRRHDALPRAEGRRRAQDGAHARQPAARAGRAPRARAADGVARSARRSAPRSTIA